MAGGWSYERRDYSELPLSEFRPKPMLRVEEHVVARAAFAATDFHNHLGRSGCEARWRIPSVDELLARMDTLGIERVVNLDGRFGEELERNLDRYDRRHRGRFATFCGVDLQSFADGARGGEDLAAQLRSGVEAGARGLKIHKSLGLHFRDRHGEVVLPDRPALAPLWREAARLGVPVLIHVADPVAFFAPLDEHNERLEELLAHPDWWFGDPERFPRHATLMAAFDRLLGEHPDTTFVGAHVASTAEDLDRADALLERHANLYVDISARISELGRQPRRARAFFARWPERILFGSDRPLVDELLHRIYFRALETADEYFAYSPKPIPPKGRWAISGLELGAEILRLVYNENAARLIGPPG